MISLKIHAHIISSNKSRITLSVATTYFDDMARHLFSNHVLFLSCGVPTAQGQKAVSVRKIDWEILRMYVYELNEVMASHLFSNHVTVTVTVRV
jgi:hypothetical protein